MSNATGQDWFVEPALTDMSVAFFQDPSNFMAHNLLVSTPVDKESGKYHVIDTDDIRRVQMDLKARGAKAVEGGFGISKASYSIDVVGLEYLLPDEDRANADPSLPPERVAEQFLRMQYMLKKEADFGTDLFKTGEWGTDIAGVTTTPGTGEVYKWSDQSGDPIGDVATGQEAMLRATGVLPNVMACNYPVYKSLINNASIQDRIKGGANTNLPSLANRRLLAEILELDEVVVSMASYNAAAEGLAADNQFLLGNHALLARREPISTVAMPSAAVTLNWNTYLPNMNEFGYVVESFRDGRADTDVWRARGAYTHHKVASALGYFFSEIA